MAYQLIKIPCASALHKLKRKTPYGWDLNIYKGCAHGCIYCFALYSHPKLQGTATTQRERESRSAAEIFSQDIYVKENIAEKLERELSSPKWNREVINIGGVTDSYQNAEEACLLMPEVLRLLIKYRTPAIISTKSSLILRDYDLIDQLSRITYINIAATITTMDEALRLIIEPMGAPSAERFAMLREFRKTNASVGVHVMPILPFLTDSTENLEAIFSEAQAAAVHYLLPGSLYLRGKTKPSFLAAIRRYFPDRYSAIQELYTSGRVAEEYKRNLYATIRAQKDKYGISSSWIAPKKEKMEIPHEIQLELF